MKNIVRFAVVALAVAAFACKEPKAAEGGANDSTQLNTNTEAPAGGETAPTVTDTTGTGTTTGQDTTTQNKQQ